MKFPVLFRIVAVFNRLVQGPEVFVEFWLRRTTDAAMMLSEEIAGNLRCPMAPTARYPAVSI